MKSTLIKIGTIVTLLIFAISCQDETTPQSEPVSDAFDQDMLDATVLANSYLNDIGARTTSSDSATITVLRYENGQLLYSTNNDSIEGYQVITEETVTAFIGAGEHVFWYSGTGVNDLDGIDFDETSEEFLGDDSDEISQDMMWTIVMPEEIDSTQQFLKYDIIYQFEGNTGDPIRLDPKLAPIAEEAATLSENAVSEID